MRTLGIIPSRHIASVMNDGKFAAGLINDRTQIVFMDEWTPECLSCDDAKRILQGNFEISSPIIVCVCNVY